MPSSGASRLAVRIALPVILLIALASVTGATSTTSPGPSAGSTAMPRVAPSPVEVDVIGDSLSTGLATPGDPWTSNAEQLLMTQGRDVQFVNAAENGAGYVARGNDGDTFLDEVDQVVSARAQIVLVFGSDNDLGRSGLDSAVTATLARINTSAPNAELIVVGPPAPPAQDAQHLEAIRDTLQTAAAQAGAQFVDPLTLGWFQGESAGYVASDNEHPDTQGEQFLAEQMAAILAPAIDRASTA